MRTRPPLAARLVLGLLAGLGVLLLRPAAAQPAPIRWERVGVEGEEVSSERNKGLAFRRGADPSGALDTLYVVNGDGVFRFRPGASAWDLMCTICVGDHMAVTPSGVLIIGSPAGPEAGGARSLDGGRTWQRDIWVNQNGVREAILVLYQSTTPPLGGAVYACNGAFCARSFTDGVLGSWEAGGPMGGETAALTEVSVLPALPNGRLLGGAWNGAAYSDDAGMTWQPSSLWGAFRFVVSSLAFQADPAHPFGGRAFAGVRDFQLGRVAVYQSDDGGVTWALVLAVTPGNYGLPSPDWVEVWADPRPGGAVYAGVEDIPGGTAPSVGPVLASWDGGQTWVQVADSTNGWGGFAPNVFVQGRDGRLYVATHRGVWRTVAALPVASEAAPEAPPAPGARLEVVPNPARGEATVRLTLDRPAAVEVAAYDGRGRRVAVLATATLPAGRHTFAWAAGALPAGTYHVRAEADGRVVARHAVTWLR